MSDATGILAYGYDLGESLTFAGLDEYDTPAWWDGEQYNNVGDILTRRLLDLHGFTERFEDGRDGYWPREKAAKDALGVQVVRNSCDAAPTWLLAAHVITGEWGEATVISLPELALRIDRLDERLAWAVQALGIQPAAEHPDWLLTADWG